MVLLVTTLCGAPFPFGAFASANGVAEPLTMIVDDFADSDCVALTGDPWSLLEYGSGRGILRNSMTEDGDAFLAVDAHTAGLVGVLLRFTEPQDLSAYTGLYVSISSSAPIRFKAEICSSGGQDGQSGDRCGSPGIRFPATSTKHVVRFPFSSFHASAEDGGLCSSSAGEIDASAVQMLNFQTWGLAGVTLRIHEVGFYKSGLAGIDAFPTYGEPLFVIDDFEDGNLESNLNTDWRKNVFSGEYGDQLKLCQQDRDHGCCLQASEASRIGLGLRWEEADFSDYEGIYVILNTESQCNIGVEVVTLEHPLSGTPLYIGASHGIRASEGTAEYRIPFSEFSTYPVDDIAFSQNRRIVAGICLYPQTQRDAVMCFLEVGLYRDQSVKASDYEVHWAGEDPAPTCEPSPELGSTSISRDETIEPHGLTLTFDRAVEFVYVEGAIACYASEEGDQIIGDLFDKSIAVGESIEIAWIPSEASLVSWEWILEDEDARLPQCMDRWGFTLPWLYGANYSHALVFEALDNLIATGANDVILVPKLRMVSATSSTLEFDGGREAQLRGLRRVARYLIAAGMHVCIKAGVYSEDQTPMADLDPEDSETWFQQYGEALMAYGFLAQELGVEAIYLTNELTTVVTNRAHTGRWIELIRSLRTVFSGQLSINATKVEDEGIEAMEVLNIPFADELDFVGISLYGALTCSRDPSVPELCSAWHGSRTGLDYVDLLHRVYERYGKPVMISEIAYPGYDGVNMQLRFGVTQGSPDDLEQSDCFEAAIRVLAMEGSRNPGWLRGISAWAWFTLPDPTEPLPGTGWQILNGDRNAFIQNKPAEHLLTTLFELLSEQ